MYLPLTEAYVIRLIELEPGGPDDPVAIHLLAAELDHCLEYEALSYVWGDAKNTLPISCNGRRFEVTVNLHAALVRARDVAALVHEHADRMSGYSSILQMPVLKPNDPLLEDPRWKSFAKLMNRPWFKRAWVLQEVGLAKDPVALYGQMEFSYRDAMNLARWVARCASGLQSKVPISLFAIHTDWEDWSSDWREKSTYPTYTLLEFLSQARGLKCHDPRDQIYAFLGHPLAQLEDRSGPIIMPDYSKDVSEVFRELTILMIQKFGLCVLSALEHNESTLSEDFPSWILPWDVELAQCSFGCWSEFYYWASADVIPERPAMVEGNKLRVRGVILDVVRKSNQFSPSSEDLEKPSKLRDLRGASHEEGTLDCVWKDVQEREMTCVYPWEERLEAFSLTLCAGLTTPYLCAEKNLEQHWANFAAYWGLRLQSSSTGELPAELQRESEKGDADNF
ncbi:uncharacterized protein PAC_10142 [Phialocephala subalpina]|uniref:Heterokaryon incompatibility domain-containing protein n=1 Tax=Phialocephala subalpina TaxID=576137 RepID=A0A1L7X5E8_9HELO|nr:uncharacterized protein PAC_10142 [Phialocephala subalpina]